MWALHPHFIKRFFSLTEVVKLTQDLIKRVSITPNDAGCQQIMQQYLQALGFRNETLIFEDTTNLWSRKGSNSPVFCFAGHTDVVPTGPTKNWTHDPFAAVVSDGFIHGRGAADMKGSLAAMLVATKQFVEDHPNHIGSIAFLITSDEEGPFINGTTRVIDTLEARNEKIDYCIVGEPSSDLQTGDIVKNGRRGSLTGELTVCGVQGHVAYPHLVKNPIHLFAPALDALSTYKWDTGNAHFPATSFQVSNIKAGTGAANVVPGKLSANFNFRYSTELSHTQIQEKVIAILDQYGLDYELEWTLNGRPFITPEGKLVDVTKAAIQEICGFDAKLSTAGGTSDGRFIAPTGAEVVELGPENATIHKIDEKVKIENLALLVDIYYNILKKMLVTEHA